MGISFRQRVTIIHPHKTLTFAFALCRILLSSEISHVDLCIFDAAWTMDRAGDGMNRRRTKNRCIWPEYSYTTSKSQDARTHKGLNPNANL